MGRKQLSPEQKIEQDAIKLRGTPGQNAIYREAAAELGLVPAEFARNAALLLIRNLEEHRPDLMARALKRANRVLAERGMAPLTAEQLITELEQGPMLDLLLLDASESTGFCLFNRKKRA